MFVFHLPIRDALYIFFFRSYFELLFKIQKKKKNGDVIHLKVFPKLYMEICL